jgi:predicted transcriptional regulator
MRFLSSEARRMIACRLVKEYGIPLSYIARYVGVSPSAVSKMIGGERK